MTSDLTSKLVYGTKLGTTLHSCGCSGPGFVPIEKDEFYQHLKGVQNSYQRKLTERDKSFSDLELKEYLNYWHAKLKKVEEELKTTNQS